MKILFYAPAAIGGHAEYTFELLRGIARRKPENWELHLATRKGLAPEFRSPEWHIHEVFPAFRSRQQFSSRAAWAASRLGYNLREPQALDALLRREPWDIVHFQEVSPLFHRSLLRRSRGAARFVYTAHNLQQHKRMAPLVAKRYDRLTFDAWSKFDGLIFHSARLRQAASRVLTNYSGMLGVVPHGIWSVPLQPRERTNPARPVRLLFLGVIRANKGLHLLLDAFARHPTATLTIAGAITDPRYFEAEIAPRLARLGAARDRLVTEFAFLEKPRMLEHLEQADYLVLPYTDFESQSGMLMYAMACGVPVIASNVGALGETVREHAVGRTYSAAAPEGLPQALLAATPEGSDALRGNVRRYAGEHSWENAGARHCDFYRAVRETQTSDFAPTRFAEMATR